MSAITEQKFFRASFVSRNIVATARVQSVVKSAVTLSLLVFATSGCVSVNLGSDKTEKSEGVSFAAPKNNAGNDFKPMASPRADAAWNNKTTGSTIAFQSSCGDAADTSLESIAQDLFAGFDNVKDLRNEPLPFDGREALVRDVEGKVDGVVTRVHAIIYKKNKCSYVLTLVTLAKSLVAQNGDKPDGRTPSGDLAAFEQFAASFKAP